MYPQRNAQFYRLKRNKAPTRSTLCLGSCHARALEIIPLLLPWQSHLEETLVEIAFLLDKPV